MKINKQCKRWYLKVFSSAVIIISIADGAATGRINALETHQTMEGFGASIAFYENWLTAHPNKADIYANIFNDLGLDILRIRNTYANSTTDFASNYSDIIDALHSNESEPTKILMSSWTPPLDIKSNGSLINGGTLSKADNKFVYGAFAQYLIDALNAFKDYGIEPDYISLQNEPTFTASWESCRFDPNEGTNAGYRQALDTVYAAIQSLEKPPKLLAAEVHGIGYNTFQNYASQFNHNHMDVYCYHLYHGESDNVNDNHNPDLFINNLKAIANTYTDHPIWQTEYDRGSWLKGVWLMHNCIVEGNVSAYFYWPLVWASGGGLIEMENPWNSGSWTTPSGFNLRTEYWAFRQFAKYISSGWKRVTTESSLQTIKLSAYTNPDNSKLTIVAINVGATDEILTLDLQNYLASSGAVTITSDTQQGEEILSDYTGSTALILPSNSIMTIAFTGDVVNSIKNNLPLRNDFELSQNYPNPFNPSTTIKYQIPLRSHVALKIFDILGNNVKTLVDEVKNAGSYTVRFNGSKLSSGIYFYRIETSTGFAQTNKMLIMK